MIQLAKYYNLSPDKLTREQFVDYLYYLVEVKQSSAVYFNQLISAFKILTVEVLRRKWEEFDIRRPMTEFRLPVVLSQDEVKQFIDSASNMKHQTFISLIYSCGLRVSGVVNLKLTGKRVTIRWALSRKMKVSLK